MHESEIGALDYITLKKMISALTESYSFLKVYSIGKSCFGRDIPALQLGSAGEYVLIAAAFHGSEHITSTVLMRFILSLCKALSEKSSIAGFNAARSLFGKGVIFIPRVNPDGCEIVLHGASGCGISAENITNLCSGKFESWNANLRGVDINHNFSAGWNELHKKEQAAGITGPSPSRFGGYRPESEPETIALIDLCRTRRMRHIVALHSQGEVIYWSFGNTKPPRSERMAEILSSASGYTLETPETLATGGGFKDWFIEEFNRPGFTVEIGRGSNPLPIEQAAALTDRLREILMLSIIM